jgi:hypothetical protein
MVNTPAQTDLPLDALDLATVVAYGVEALYAGPRRESD